MKKLILVAALSALSLNALAAKLELIAYGVEGKPAKLYYAIIDDPKQFPDGKTVANGIVAVNGTQTEVKVTIDLPPGSYAISTFLDVNGNGKMDKKLGIPSEKFAFSNNPKLKFGPPSFSQCEIRVMDRMKNSTSIKLKPFKNHLGV